MTYLTADQIKAAKNNEIDAVTAVIAATEELVTSKARRYATGNGWTDSALAEDLAQTGRIAVWEALAKFEGETPAQFMTYLDRTLHGVLNRARWDETRQGVSRAVAETFERALTLAAGDPYEAERLATTDALGTHKMRPDLAYAARVSWQGLVWIDIPAGEDDDGEGVTLGAALASEIGIPEDLLEPRDVETHRRKVVREQVHGTLGQLSERMRHVLKATHGISPVAQYGAGDHDDELAADMGLTPYQVQQARTKGGARFAALYLQGAAA
ncbi:sigma-70 family RNA polymerase sigma factor [Streptomyces sp. NPDC001404]|uniref:sigma-70 family RNA polymerase sigma factor n=1 Tax=Streptomyces sp. NPDC001404 TaxID=3364571 RepID=UPI00367EED86